jgi:uncharacterized protein YkwD
MPRTRALLRPRGAARRNASTTGRTSARRSPAVLAALAAVLAAAAPARAGQGRRQPPEPAAGLTPVVATAPDLLTPPELTMLAAVNAERAAAGLPSLELDPTLTTTARNHSMEMHQAGRVYHTPDLTAIGLQIPRWGTITENVGVGRSAEALHRTFMGSRSHRAAILGRYDRIGLGVVVASNRMWVTQQFVRLR